MTVTCRICRSRVSIPEETLSKGAGDARCASCGEMLNLEAEHQLDAALELAFQGIRVGDRDAAQPEGCRNGDRSDASPSRHLSAPRDLSDPGATLRISPTGFGDSMGQSAVLPPPPGGESGRVPGAQGMEPAGGSLLAGSTVEVPLDSVAAIAAGSPTMRARYRIMDKQGRESILDGIAVVRLIRDGRLHRSDLVSVEGSGRWVRAGTIGGLERYFDLRQGGLLRWRELPQLLCYPLAGWGPVALVACALVGWMAAFSGAAGGALLALVLIAYSVTVVRTSAQGADELPGWADLASWRTSSVRAVLAAIVIILALLPPSAAAVLALGFVPATAELPEPQPRREIPIRAGSHQSPADPTQARGVGTTAGGGTAQMETPWSRAGSSTRLMRERLRAAADDPNAPLERLKQAGAPMILGVVLALLLTALYLPMGFLVCCFSETARATLNPMTTIRAIRSIPGDYAATLALCAALGGMGALALPPTSRLPLLGGAGTAIAATYLLLIMLHVLGRLEAKCEPKLDWRLLSRAGEGVHH